MQQHILHQISHFALWRSMYFQRTKWIFLYSSLIYSEVQLFLLTITMLFIIRTWNYFNDSTIQMDKWLISHILTLSLMSDFFLKKHFALFMINITFQRLWVLNFVTFSFLYLLLHTLYIYLDLVSVLSFTYWRMQRGSCL